MDQNSKIAVLLGGSSKERDVSLTSGKSVATALRDQGYRNVHEVDPQDVPDYYQQHWDAVFIALHGEGGEDGTVQKILTNQKIAFTGSDEPSSTLAMSKVESKKVFLAQNIPTLPFVASHKDQPVEEVLAEIDAHLSFPIIGKPDTEGSSIGMSVVQCRQDVKDAFDAVHQFGDTVLWENFINEGVDLTVAVVKKDALPVVEIVPKQGLYDYDAKYTKGMTDYYCPARISEELTKKVQAYALQAFDALGCRSWGRVDFLLYEDELYCLEVNTIPGMTPTSLVPMAAKEKGWSFEVLVETILLDAC